MPPYRCVISICLMWWVAAFSITVHADEREEIARRKSAHVPKMSYLENKQIKVGIDLNLGGAITYVSRADRDDNLVNNWDWGRQIQMSHYSGPSPFRVPGKEPAKAWAHFGWNPVQAGDHFGHASKVLKSSNDGKVLRATCQPMQWSLPDVPCECTYETELRLDGATVLVRNRITTTRTDKVRYGAYPQELPAVYVNGSYYRLFAYTGDQPFTNAKLSRIEKKTKGGFPWERFRATENWAAHVNDADFGLGVYQPRCVTFLGGFAGRPGKGDTRDTPTGYIAPVGEEHIDPEGTFAYDYVLCIGSLAEIRATFNRIHGPIATPKYEFRVDRQGWIVRGGRDEGVSAESWTIPLDKRVEVVSPETFWQAADSPVLIVEAAFATAQTEASLYWATHDDPKFVAERRTSFPIQGNGVMREHRIDLSKLAGYSGALSRLRIDPGIGESVRIKSVRFTK